MRSSFFTVLCCCLIILLGPLPGFTQESTIFINEKWAQWEKASGSTFKGGRCVLSVPGMENVRVGTVEYSAGLMMDVFYPPKIGASVKLPVVIFVNGWQKAAGKDTPRDISWGQVTAAMGIIAVTYAVKNDNVNLDQLLSFLLKNGLRLGIDAERVALFARGFATSTFMAMADTAKEYHRSLRCAVFYYAGMGPSLTYRPPKDIPLFINTATQESWCVESVAAFLEQVKKDGAPLVRVESIDALSTWDISIDTERSREIIAQTFEFMKQHLVGR